MKEAIIFDLGGVIIDIDPRNSFQAFRELGVGKLGEDHSKAEQDEIFSLLETGQVSPQEFRDELRKKAGIDASDEAIDNAWNAMLIDIPEERFKLLEILSEDYPLYLLSNTNAIHIHAFSRIVENKYGYEKFLQLFQGVHFSHELGYRKPNSDIFKAVLKQEKLIAEDTLFLDDTYKHVEGARKVGIEAYHLDPPGSVVTFFDQWVDRPRS